MYVRQALLTSLPGVRALRGAHWFNILFLRAYASGHHIAANAIVLGDVFDPELTFIGAGAVVGDGCRLVAHSAVRLPEGMALHFDTIRIGERATIGGGSQIELGAVIGDHAIVEPGSRVAPYTRIPAGEVWGGSPAVLRRTRAEHAWSAPGTARATPDPDVDSTIAAIELALGLPIGRVSADTSALTCTEWDSLGRLAIAACVHDRFDVDLTSDEIARLDSVATVHGLIRCKRDRAGALPAVLPSDPELLPLLDPARATAALPARTMAAGDSGAPLRICIAATFVAHPLASTIRAWCHAFNVQADISFAEFNQVLQTLLDVDGPFHRNRYGVNVILARPEDLVSDENLDDRRAADLVLCALEAFVGLGQRRVIVGDLPIAVGGQHRQARHPVDQLRRYWSERLVAIPGVEPLSFADIVEELGVCGSYRPEMDGTVGLPYTPAVYQRLGIAISRAARKLRIPPKKVAAVDADGTLWGGAIAEDGPHGVVTNGGYRRTQEVIAGWKAAGALLVLVSRNEPADVWDVFDAHPEMPLHAQDFVAARIGWGAKSASLRELAAELNVALDSFVFLDDNAAERAEVADRHPEVTVPELGQDGNENAAMLAKLWCFDTSCVTDDDSARTERLRAESRRRQLALAAGDSTRFLEQLGVRVEMRRARPADLPRVAQLTQKTNQLNLSLRRRTVAEVERIAATHAIWIASVRDRFGEYGTVGLAVLAPRSVDRVIELDTFLLSCRALGRGVEAALLHAVTRAARDDGALELHAPFVEGPRNAPALELMRSTGWHRDDVRGMFRRATVSSEGEAPSHVQLTIASDAPA